MTPEEILRRIKEGTVIPWYERAGLEAEFHEKKVKEYGHAKRGRPDSLVGKRGWSLKDSARELSLSTGFLCEDLRLWKEVRDWPELKEYNRDSALKMIRLKDKKK